MHTSLNVTAWLVIGATMASCTDTHRRGTPAGDTDARDGADHGIGGDAADPADPGDSAPTGRHAPFAGMYALDTPTGTYRDGVIASVAGIDFVDGFVWRQRWSELELGKDSYDLASVAHIVRAVDAANLGLSLLLLEGGPSYLAADPLFQGTSWKCGRNQAFTCTTPWAPYVKERAAAFFAALANLEIDGVALRDHECLHHLLMPVPGLSRLREYPTDEIRYREIPGYTRELFIEAVINALVLAQQLFPRTNIMLSMWDLQDDDTQPPLYEALADAIAATFTGAAGPTIGIVQDNLAASVDADGVVSGYPRPDYARVMSYYHTSYNGPTGFQMLTSWAQPWTPAMEEKTAGGTTATGMTYGVQQFGSSYFEIYQADLLEPSFAADLQAAHSQLWSGY